MLALATWNVLVVEDNPGDVRLIREAFAEIRNLELEVVGNSVLALQYLGKLGPYADAPTPNLVILDLKLPVFDGIYALTEIRRAGKWEDIPIVMFTSSEQSEDRRRCLALGAVAYQVKPRLWTDWVEVLAGMLSSHLRFPLSRDDGHTPQ